jgi:hypothetical protein
MADFLCLQRGVPATLLLIKPTQEQVDSLV